VILDELVRAVGFGIPIQQLFDLVVGTSTGIKRPNQVTLSGKIELTRGTSGGVIALGIFEKRWSPDNAKRLFRDLIVDAFTKRRRLKIPAISRVVEPFCTFKYQSIGIDNALQDAFGGGEYLFGQSTMPTASGADIVKVGVVSCLEGQNQPCLIANYGRNPRPGADNCSY